MRLSDGDIDLLIREWNTTELSDQKIANERFMQEFCKYDYALGWDHLPLNPELIQDIIDAGPDADGMYQVDGDSLALDEANEILQDFAHYQDICDEHLHTLQTYFPELTWSDLTTQDY